MYHYETQHPYHKMSIRLFLLRTVRVAKHCNHLSVCLSARVTRKPCGRTSPNFCACCPWSWLGPPLTALRHVMYFRYYRWRHVFIPWDLYKHSYLSRTHPTWLQMNSDWMYKTLQSRPTWQVSCRISTSRLLRNTQWRIIYSLSIFPQVASKFGTVFSAIIIDEHLLFLFVCRHVESFRSYTLPTDGSWRNLRSSRIYFMDGFKAWTHTKLVWKFGDNPLRDGWGQLSRNLGPKVNMEKHKPFAGYCARRTMNKMRQRLDSELSINLQSYEWLT